MAAIVTSQSVEKAVHRHLKGLGFQTTGHKKNGETGVDIEATCGEKRLCVEAISYKSAGSARAKDFFEVFFRAISRIDKGYQTCVIALPAEFSKGLKDRARQYGSAWTRIGRSFPELQISLVDTTTQEIIKTDWNYWGE